MIFALVTALLLSGTPHPTPKQAPKVEQKTKDQYRAELLSNLHKAEKEPGAGKLMNVFWDIESGKDSTDLAIALIESEDGQMVILFYREGGAGWHAGPMLMGMDMMIKLEKVEISVPDAGVDKTKK